jgi:hypothetical protein
MAIDPIKAVLQVPLPYGLFGHYRVVHRCGIVATQAAGSRLFSFRNSHASNLLVATRLIAKIVQTGNFTATIEDSLDVFRATIFSVSDTVNTVTPTTVVKRTVGMAAAPGAAEIRGVTIAGAAAGMTGGTLTKDGAPFAQLPALFLATLPSNQVLDVRLDEQDDDNGSHPFLFGPAEGFEIENRVLLGAAAAASLYIDFSWAEIPVGTF